MKTNAIKHYSEILSDARVQKQLLKSAPRSCISGKPLTLTLTRADKSDSRSFRLIFENSLDPDGWIGQQDGIHTRHHREQITPDQIESAALAVGLDRDEVILAVTGLRLEIHRSVRDMNEFVASRNAQAEEFRREKSAKYAGASIEEKREMIYQHYVFFRQLLGRRSSNRRKALRKELKSQTPPETFNF